MKGNGRLFEYFLVLGDSPAKVIEKIPATDHEDAPISPMLDTLPTFAFPDKWVPIPFKEAQQKSPRFVTFVITGPTYQCFYISCLHIHEETGMMENDMVMYQPKIFCLASLHPYLQLSQLALEAILHLAVEHRDRKDLHIAIQHLLFEVPLPPSVPRSQTVFSIGSLSLSILEGSFTRDFSFRPLFACLSTDKIIQLFFLILTEKKVALVTHRPSLLLVYVCEAIRSLLYPFKWHHVYAPLLPPGMWAALECPAPFIIGISVDKAAENREKIGEQVPPDVVLFDLDFNKTFPNVPEVLIPKNVFDMLMRRLPVRTYYTPETRSVCKDYWDKFGTTFLKEPNVRSESSRGYHTSPSKRDDDMPRPFSMDELSSRQTSEHHNSPPAPRGKTDDMMTKPSRRKDGNYAKDYDVQGPRWSESAECRYRRKVQAVFLEIVAILFFDCELFFSSKEFLRAKFLKTREGSDAPSATYDFLDAFFRTNSWDFFATSVLKHGMDKWEPFHYACSLVNKRHVAKKN